MAAPHFPSGPGLRGEGVWKEGSGAAMTWSTRKENKEQRNVAWLRLRLRLRCRFGVARDLGVMETFMPRS